MLITDIAIRRSILTVMMASCLLVLGGIGLLRIGMDLYPDVTVPVVVVSVAYPGAGPEQVESEVVAPIEDALSGIGGVSRIRSWSRDNFTSVVAEFQLSSNLDVAVQEVRDKVSSIRDKLPRDVEPPVFSRLGLSSSPVVSYAVSAELEPGLLTRLVQERIRPGLARIPSVAEVRLLGAPTRQIQIEIHLDKARAVGLSPLDIARRLGEENINSPVGRLGLGPHELSVRTVGQLDSVEQIAALPMASAADGSQVRLDEVATITDGMAERRTLTRLNSQEALVVEVYKQPGANGARVADQVKAQMTLLEAAFGHGFKAAVINDQSLLIKENAKDVWIALLFGGAMALVIILVFLLDLRGTLISALALPTSVVGTFFVMYVLGYTLNQMTLLALALAIGLLIDDAVVVREAINHRLELGEPPMLAAAGGTRDVGLAVVATTLSLVAVFVPVAFMPGVVGQFFQQFGITLSVAVLISLFVSFTLDPMLSARLAKVRVPGEVRRDNAVARVIRAGLETLERCYGALLRWLLAHKRVVGLLTLGVLGLALFSARNLQMELLPTEDRSQFFVDLQLRDSASLEETNRHVAETEALLRQIPEVSDIYSEVGPSEEVHKARVQVMTVARNARTRGIGEIQQDARTRLAVLPATQFKLSEPSMIEGAGDFVPIVLHVSGPELSMLQEYARQLSDYLRESATQDVRVEGEQSKPELRIQVDRVRAADVALSAEALAMQLRLAVNGQLVGKLREGAQETGILVRLSEYGRATPERLRQMEVVTRKGPMPLSEIAQVSQQEVPTVIVHENRQRQLTVMAQLAPGAALGEVGEHLKSRLKAHPLPAGYMVEYDGQLGQLNEQNDAFGSMFVLAILFVFMVLAAQFDSLVHPLTIILSLPLALVGALLALVVGGYHLSIGALIGLILLMGLVTKNAILLVDGTLQHLRVGGTVEEALLKACPRRLRPILMTSAAMAIGMVPTALGRGQGSEFRAPMAVAVIGGILSSTLLTLIVVPIIFAGFEHLRPRRKPDIGAMDGADGTSSSSRAAA